MWERQKAGVAGLKRTRRPHVTHQILSLKWHARDGGHVMLVAAVVLTRPRRCGKSQPFASVNTARLPLTQEPEIALSPRLESCCIRRSPECWFSHESRPSYDCPDQICKHSEKRKKKKSMKWASVLRKQFLILLTVGLWWMAFADDFQPVYIWF